MVGIFEKVKNFLKTGDSNKSVNLTCHDPAQDMVDCISQTECFQSGRSIKECGQSDDQTGNMCKKPIMEYYLCRKFSVNNQKHFVKDTYK